MARLPRIGAALLLLAALCTLPLALQAQFLLSPAPGSIFKEYSRAMTASTDWRVTDPNTPRADAQQYLPNRVLTLSVADLSGATRAELLMDVWGGHVGTVNKRFRFNSNTWISIPELGAGNGIPAGHNGECYTAQLNPVIAVPLTHLRTGSNTFEGTSGGQTCYNFNWGQWGWYGVVLRVYYGSSKPHPEGSITSPGGATTIGDNPTVNVAITSGSVAEVRVLAHYSGFDPDGDGVRSQYNYAYHRFKSETTFNMKYHVGTDNASPFSIPWNNALVPDQGGIKLVAWIKATDGTIFVTNEVTNVTLARTGAYVRVYPVTNMPERFWVRSGRTTKTVNFTIPSGDAISNARSATLVLPNWNGDDVSERSFVNTKVNSWTTPFYGSDHHFQLDFITVPISALRQGSNDIIVTATTVEHGIEIMWPGPHMVVRFGGAASNTPPSITQQPQSQTVSVGQTAVFSVAASGTSPLSYRWQKNNVNISGAPSAASYTTPAAASGDNGSTFRCIVTNSYGADTSNAATLTVSSTGNVPPSITQNPVNRAVTVGQTAVFSVVATGTAPLSYQWQKNNANVSGATSAYTTPPAALTDNGATFRCIVSNAYGKDTSGSATLTVTEQPPPPAGNLIENPGFENGASPWRFFTDGAGTFSSVMPGFAGSYAGRIQINTAGGNVQFYQTGFMLQSGARYRLTFSAYSSTGHDLSIFVQQHGSPYANFGLSGAVFALTTRYQTFTREFIAGGFAGSTTDTRLRFWLAPYDAAGDQYFIDDVKLEVVSPASTDLAAGPSPEDDGGVDEVTDTPQDFLLSSNYPNPFNPSTSIEFGLPEQADVTLAVYNMLGQQVALLASGGHAAGRHRAVWDSRDASGSQVGSGVYLYRLTATGASGRTFTSLQKMILMK